MPPDTPLWDEVVAEEGLQAVWPTDCEDSARLLNAAWTRLADQVGEGGFQVSKAAGVVESSWPDPAGNAAVNAVTAYFDRIKEVALQMAWISTLGLSYADQIETAKNAVRDTIAGWEQAYAAAGVPRFGKDTAYQQSLVVFYAAQACFRIIDDAARDIRTTLHSKAVNEKFQLEKGGIDLGRQIGNVLSLAGAIDGVRNRAILAAATALKTDVDIDAGESVGQARVSNWSGAIVNVGVGLALRKLGPVGMLGGMTASAFTSGFVDSLYENGPTHLSTAVVRGGEEVGETFEGMGKAFDEFGKAVVGRVEDAWERGN